MTEPFPIVRSKHWRSWGRVRKASHWIAKPHHLEHVENALTSALSKSDTALAVGLARSYGTSGLNPDQSLLDMRGLDRLCAFDPVSGILRAEAGISLWDILSFCIPRGYFLPTTPGTRYVTLGGAIANDVHGKNHHTASTLGAHISKIGLLRSDLGKLEICPSSNPALFSATIGGLGLTGIILWADIQLVKIPSSRLVQEREKFANLDAFFDIANARSETHEFTVAWVDCLAKGKALGRGLFSSANWCEDGERTVCEQKSSLNVPVDLPGFLMNNLSIGVFNSLYYGASNLKLGRSHIDYGPFFYPLDSIGNWNRLYGRKGFYQYQSVIPVANARQATQDMLKTISDSGLGSFLAVLKTFGDKPSPGMLSFPMEGTTLALDFPEKGENTIKLMSRLDDIVAAANGRVYPAKDGRIPKRMMVSGFPKLFEFMGLVDPKLSSEFSRSLEI